jgi:hypothetical protein
VTVTVQVQTGATWRSRGDVGVPATVEAARAAARSPGSLGQLDVDVGDGQTRREPGTAAKPRHRGADAMAGSEWKVSELRADIESNRALSTSLAFDSQGANASRRSVPDAFERPRRMCAHHLVRRFIARAFEEPDVLRACSLP